MSIKVSFTENLRRHVACDSIEAAGANVREVLDDAFRKNPAARPWILDEQGALRRHMTVFVDGRQLEDRAGLSDKVAEGGELWIMQALSGG